MEDVRTNPPATLIRLTVWLEPSMLTSWFCPFHVVPTGSNLYYILSGQHLVTAAVRVSQEIVKQKRPVPRCEFLQVNVLLTSFYSAGVKSSFAKLPSRVWTLMQDNS